MTKKEWGLRLILTGIAICLLALVLLFSIPVDYELSYGIFIVVYVILAGLLVSLLWVLPFRKRIG